MRLGPSRGIAVGGVAFGIIVLVSGLLLFLNDQGYVQIRIGFWTVCAIGLIVVGLASIVGAVWARGFIRRGWRQWMSEDWSQKEWPKQ